MGKRDQKDKVTQKVEAVLDLLRKQAPLTVKQEKFCNYACVERFLKAKGDNVKKAAKHLRACLSWRESIGTEYLIADEFSAELAEGFAYVSGHDNESRPVVILRIKQDYQKFHSQKLYIRLLVFTLEVAIGSMPKNVEEFVLLFDASFFRSASAFMNLLMASLKILSEYYPGRLHKSFIIDPPSLFSYMWKGVRPFVDLSPVTTVISSLDYEESLEYDDFSSFPRASSLRFDPSSIPSTGKVGTSSSTRFSFTVSQHFDSVKPWYLSLTDTSASKVGTGTGTTTPSPTLMGPARISPLNARSFSFASPAARTPRCSTPGPTRKNHQIFTSTPLITRSSNLRTPRPSFLQSPAMFFRKDKDKEKEKEKEKECHVSRMEKSRDSFLPFLRLYRKPYDEMAYRSKMKPPLGGLISIVSPHMKRRHMSLSQRF